MTTHRRALPFLVSLIFPLLPVFALLVTSPAHAQTSATLWSQRFGSNGQDIATSVALDFAGNVYVAGHFSGSVDFGGGPLVCAGVDDIVVAKFNTMGVHQWSKRFGSTAADEAYGISVDANGNSYTTGYFNGTVDFGGGPLVSAGSTDIFVLRLDANGAHTSSQRFGDTGADVGLSTNVDASGEYGVTGSFSGSVNFGGGALTSAGGTDIFVARYGYGAVYRWSQRFGGTGSDIGRRLLIDPSSNVIVTGDFASTVDFGGGPLTSAGVQDVFLAKYDSNGNHLWSRSFGGTGTERGYGLAVDASSNVVLCGNFQNSVDFGGGSLTSAGIYDAFLAKYNSSGVHQWSRRFGSTANDIAFALTTDASANAIVTGYFTGTVDFGAGALTVAGGVDVFVAKYDPSGTCQWSQRFGNSSDERGRAVAADAEGNAFVTGDFAGAVNFGNGILIAADPLTTVDMFLVKLTGAVAEPAISNITDVPNDQGRRVRIQFSRGSADNVMASIPVTHYVAFRRNSPAPAMAAAAGAANARNAAAPELLAGGWTQVGSVDAFGEATYSMEVPTLADSTLALGQYWSAFYVRAATGMPTVFYDSPADSGWSIDNLAPGIPANFAYDAGDLSWNESTAEDFDFFTVYGSNTDSFGSATLVNYSVAPAMDVTASPYVFYFVTATDFSGNEGKPARVNTLSGAGGAPKHYVLSVSSFPNPFNPRTTVSYTVPSRGRVSIVVYDAHGARVRTLFDGERSAGAYTTDWDGRGDDGVSVSSGVYFARIEQNGATRSKKMLLLK